MSEPKQRTRPPRRKGNHWYKPARYSLIVLLLIVIGVVVATLLPTTRWVHAGGYVVTDDEAELRPSQEGTISEWLVSTGDMVEKGQALVQLNDKVQRAAYEQAVSRLAREQAELERLQSQQALNRQSRSQDIEQAQRNLALQRLMVERITTTAGAFSQKEVEEARLKVQLAESQLAAARLDPTDLMKRQIKVLRQDITTLEKDLARLEAELELRRVRAPIGGKVYFQGYETGEVVKTDDVLGQVFDPSQWIVRLRLNERDMPFVQAGQTVRVSLSAYPSYRFGYATGRVATVNPVVSQQATGDGVLYVEAAIDDFGNLEPRAGLTADAWINTGQTTWLFRLIGWR